MATKTKKKAPKESAAQRLKAKKSVAKKPAVFRVDLSAFSPESVARSERSLCVACVWQIFTRAMSLAHKTALSEIKRYTPSFEELTSAEAFRLERDPFCVVVTRQPSGANWAQIKSNGRDGMAEKQLGSLEFMQGSIWIKDQRLGPPRHGALFLLDLLTEHSRPVH